MFQLYENPRAASWVDERTGVFTVLGIALFRTESGQQFEAYYLIAEDDTSPDSSINPRLVLGREVSLYIGHSG